jgi:hypothetical protein
MVTGCEGKYADAKKINQEYIDLLEAYITGLDKADNANAAAKAINNFADGLEDLWPRMQKLSEKYPELKDSSNTPEELKESQKKADEMGLKMASSMMKVMPFMADPKVQKAQERLGSIMMKK